LKVHFASRGSRFRTQPTCASTATRRTVGSTRHATNHMNGQPSR
jgi:hypothetical protein